MSFWVDGKQSALAATRVGGYGKLPADTHPSGGCSRHLAECPAGRRIGAGHNNAS